MTYVKRYGYRTYEGEFRGRLYRIWSIFSFHLVRSLTLSGWTKLITGAYLFLLILFHSGFVFSVQMYGDFETGYLEATFFILNNPLIILFLIVFVGLVGSPLFADDILYESIDTYRSRVSVLEYICGKFLSLFTLTCMLTLLPVIFDYFFLGFALGGNVPKRLLDAGNLELLLQASFTATLATLYVVSLVLAFSSGSKQRSHASAGFIIGSLAMTALVFLATALSDEPRVLFLSPVLLIFFIAAYTFDPNWAKADESGFAVNESNPLASVGGIEVFLFTGVIIAICWFIILYFLWYVRE